MPFIGYARLGEIVGKTEDQVREDKDSGVIDLDDFDSLVKYVAEYWNWGPKDAQNDRVLELEAQISKLKDQLRAVRAGPVTDEPLEQLGPEDLEHPTVRWKVEDRASKAKHTEDPYLRRTLERKKGNIT